MSGFFCARARTSYFCARAIIYEVLAQDKNMTLDPLTEDLMSYFCARAIIYEVLAAQQSFCTENTKNEYKKMKA